MLPLARAPQGCQRPQPSAGTLACLLGALLRGALSLDGLFAAAAAGAPPGQATAWLHAQARPLGPARRACTRLKRLVHMACGPCARS